MQKVNYIEVLDFIDKIKKAKSKSNFKSCQILILLFRKFFSILLTQKKVRGNFFKTDFDQIEQQLIKLDGKKLII